MSEPVEPSEPIEVLAFVDSEGGEVVLDGDEADTLLALTAGLDAATVSACTTCRSRVLACVALVDVLDAAPSHTRSSELIELAEDAPTLHLYVEDLIADCVHRGWRDPGRAEWDETLGVFATEPRGKR